MSVISDAVKHAQEAFPRESCGLVVVRKGREKYVPCRNVANNKHSFVIDPEDYANAEDMGAVIKVVHSHPKSAPKPSESDLIGCEKSGLPWIIVNPQNCEHYEFEPTGYELPLMGRKFQHGVIDCYTFIRDYYKQVLNIDIPDFDRADNWWQGGENLYLDGFESAGFVEVDKDDIQEHDVLLMQVISPVPNHGAIYVGNGKIQHHQVDRLSSEDVYGGWYRKIHTMTLRHQCRL